MNTNSKAESIRKVLTEMGRETPPKDVIRCLREQAIDVTPQQVTNEKAKLAKRIAAVPTQDFPVSVLKKVMALADELGSTEILRRALDMIDELKARR